MDPLTDPLTDPTTSPATGPTTDPPTDCSPIPPVAHFIWFGAELPPIPLLALRSAMARGGFSRLVLHGQDAALADDPGVRALGRDDRFRFEPLHTGKLLGAPTHRALGGEASDRLLGIYRVLRSPAARANVARLAILHREGGVYLDTDAITLASFDDLRRDPGFAGLERIALPDRLRSSRNPLRWAVAGALIGAREVFARTASGPALFSLVDRAYSLAANNAILGARVGHPLLLHALRRVARTPAEQITRPFELGTRLLQRVTGDRSRTDFVMHPPEVFFPLPPEVSWHYFRARPASRDGELWGPATRAIHLYDSVARRRLGRPLDAAWILAQGESTPLGRAIAPWHRDLERLYPG